MRLFGEQSELGDISEEGGRYKRWGSPGSPGLLLGGAGVPLSPLATGGAKTSS